MLSKLLFNRSAAAPAAAGTWRRSATRLAAVRARSSQQKRGMASGKEIAFGDSARGYMLSGVNQLADAVQTTLGPKGKHHSEDVEGRQEEWVRFNGLQRTRDVMRGRENDGCFVASCVGRSQCGD
jgi:hypothetical protein